MTSVTPWVGNTWTCSTPGREHSDSQGSPSSTTRPRAPSTRWPSGPRGPARKAGAGAAWYVEENAPPGRHRQRRRVARARAGHRGPAQGDQRRHHLGRRGPARLPDALPEHRQPGVAGLPRRPRPRVGRGQGADKVYAAASPPARPPAAARSPRCWRSTRRCAPLRRHRRGARLHRPHEVHRRQPVRRVPRHGPRQRRALGGRLAARTRPPRRAHPHRRRQGSPADTSRGGHDCQPAGWRQAGSRPTSRRGWIGFPGPGGTGSSSSGSAPCGSSTARVTISAPCRRRSSPRARVWG